MNVTPFNQDVFDQLELVIDFHGMERSGHHAMLAWFHSHFPNPSVHVPRFTNARRFRWFWEPGVPLVATVSYGRDWDFSKEPKPDRPTIIMIRDVRNMMASRRKKLGDNHPLTQAGVLNIWQVYAEEVLGITSYLGDQVIPVFYDKWFTDRRYRESIIKEINRVAHLDLKFTDKGINTVSQIGGGSSFDSMEFNGHAQNMDVTNRWKDPVYAKLMEIMPVDVLELNEELNEVYGMAIG